MALVIKDRVKETSTTTGTSNLNLAGAVSGFQGFVAAGITDTTYYALIDANGTAWEVGLGTITDGSPDTLARTDGNVIASTNSNNRISLSSGTHTVFATYPAGKAVYLDASGGLSYTVDLTADVTGTLPVGNGGTGLTSIATLLNSNVTPTSLSLVIGTNVQAYDADLAAIAGLTSAADKGIQFTGSGSAATYDLTAAGKALLDDANASAQRTTLGLAIGSDVQAYDADLAAIAGLTSAADKGIQFTGSGTAATYDLTAAGKALLDDADAAAQRTTLGVDAAGTDNSTAVTLVTSSHDYLSISTQAITLGAIDLAADVTGTLPASAVQDKFLRNDGSDTTTGTITAGGFTTTGTWTFDEFTSGTIGITTVQDSGTTFDDNDTSLMTAAAIADKIEAYSYSTTTGTVTSVAISGTDGIDVDSGSPITSSGTITLGLSSIANAKLANSSITVSDGSSSTAVALGGTMTFSGTSNEVEVGESSGTVTIGLPDDVTIAGDLTVNGDTVTVNTATLSVEDPLIILASGNNAADSVDIGFYGLYDTSGSQDLYAGLFRDANDSGKFKLFKDLQAAPTTTVDVSGTGYAVATLVANIEGDVTGNVSGTAATVTGATQAAITSAANLATVGTITTGIWQATDVAVAHGGTGASSAADARTNLGLVIGTNVQAYDAQLGTLAALTADQVGGLVDLATLEAPASDGQFIVATGSGAFAYESGATARTSLGVDAAGTDNSTNVTLVTSSHDYLSISTQAITLGAIDLAADVTGTLPVGSVSTITLGTNTAGNYVATIADAGSSRITVANSGSETAGVTLDIADNAVGIAQLAGIARGKIIVGDASGNPALLAVGSENEVLTVDSNGDAVWAAASGGGGISHDGSTANGVLTYKDSDEATVEATLTYDGTTLLASSTTDNTPPIVLLKHAFNDTTGSILKFVLDRGAAGTDGDVCGTITFYGDDDNQDNIEFARIEGIVADASNGDECGGLKFYVAENDGTNTAGLLLTGSTTDGEVDVTIGAGAASVVTIPGHIDLAGDIDVDGTLEADAITLGGTALGSLYSVIAGSSSIVTVGTVTTGTWNGTAIATAYIADDAVTGAKIALFDDSLAATTTHFLIADGTDYSSFALSGDVTCTNAGVVSIADDVIGSAELADACSAVTSFTAPLIEGTTSIQTPLIEYTDGDEAITIHDGGSISMAKAVFHPIANAAAEPEDATVNIDLRNANYFDVELGANVTDIDFTHGKVGQRFMIRFEQDASSGPYTIAWNAVTMDFDGGGSEVAVTVSWPGGTAPTMTATDDKADTYGFVIRAEGHMDGFVIGQNIPVNDN